MPETDLKQVNRFEPDITRLTTKYPRIWKFDLQQELRLIVLQFNRIIKAGEDLKKSIVINKMKCKITTFTDLERNKGIRKVPEYVDPIDYVDNDKYQTTLTGDKIRIDNHL